MKQLGAFKILLAGVVAACAISSCSSMIEAIQNENLAVRESMILDDDERQGNRFLVPRDKKTSVAVNLYIPKDSASPAPAVFHIHGGAFIGGDADLLDSLSQRLCTSWGAAFISVNYTKLDDNHDKDYAIEEICDSVLYFAAHASEYNLNTEKFLIMGYSAGGYYTMTASHVLAQKGFNLACQVLCYPYLGDAGDRLDALDLSAKEKLSPAFIIVCENDPLKDGGIQYGKKLSALGVNVLEIKEIRGAYHGFIEENNPETTVRLKEKNPSYYERQYKKDKAISPDQEALAREVESYILENLRASAIL